MVKIRTFKGNGAKSPAPHSEPPTADIGGSKPPAWMSEDAKELWRRLLPELAAAGVVTSLSINLFVVLCETHSMVCQSARALQAGGYVVTSKSGYQRPSPWLKIHETATRDYVKLVRLFKLAPTSCRCRR